MQIVGACLWIPVEPIGRSKRIRALYYLEAERHFDLIFSALYRCGTNAAIPLERDIAAIVSPGLIRFGLISIYVQGINLKRLMKK